MSQDASRQLERGRATCDNGLSIDQDPLNAHRRLQGLCGDPLANGSELISSSQQGEFAVDVDVDKSGADHAAAAKGAFFPLPSTMVPPRMIQLYCALWLGI